MPDLVTGASGFIGSHLVDQLLHEGRAVRVLLRPNSSLRWLPADQVEVVRAASWETVELARAVEGAERVFHVAGVTHGHSAEAFVRFHVEGTRALLDACRRTGSVSRVVVFSSLAAAGPAPSVRPLAETDPVSPVSWYGHSKLAQERLTEEYARDLSVVIVRPPAVYGPRDRDLLHLFRTAKKGVCPALHGGIQSFTHVADIVRGAMAASCRVVESGSVYYLASAEMVTWQAIAAVLTQVLGRRVRMLWFPRALLPPLGFAGEFLTRRGASFPLDRNKAMEAVHPRWICSPARAERELGFRASVDIAAGFRHTVEWYRTVGWL